MTLQLERPPGSPAHERRAGALPDEAAERWAIEPVLIVDVPTVIDVALPPALDAPWSLPARQSAVAPQPEQWNAGPSAWGARPVQRRRVDTLSLLIVAAVGALIAAVIARVAFGQSAAALLGFVIAFATGGALACWLGLRSSRSRRVDLERGVLVRDVYGLKGRFVGGACVDGLTTGTPVAIGQNPSAEVCLYAHGREYPLTRDDLDRVRSVMGAAEVPDETSPCPISDR